MCSIAESRLGCSPPESHNPVITFSPERAAKVSGRTNSCAAAVITTCTRIPCSCKRRTTSHALYAAIPPQTPRATFMSFIVVGELEGEPWHRWFAKRAEVATASRCSNANKVRHCHPEPHCWGKDLPRFLRLIRILQALSPEYLAD